MSAIFPFIYKRTAKTACLEEHHIGPSPIQYVVGGEGNLSGTNVQRKTNPSI